MFNQDKLASRRKDFVEPPFNLLPNFVDQWYEVLHLALPVGEGVTQVIERRTAHLKFRSLLEECTPGQGAIMVYIQLNFPRISSLSRAFIVLPDSLHYMLHRVCFPRREEKNIICESKVRIERTTTSCVVPVESCHLAQAVESPAKHVRDDDE